MPIILDTETLKSFIHYNPLTGIFTYTKTVNPRALKGQIAGSKQNCGHLSLQYNKKRYQLHQLAFLYMKGYLPKEVDHINNNPSDNRFCNLRECTRSQNSYNSSLRTDNTSGVKGLSLIKKTGLWRARIWVNKKELRLGHFRCKEEAIKALENARKQYHGEFAKCL